MQNKLLTFLITLFFIQPAFATTMNKPKTCPSVNALKTVGISSVSSAGRLGWIGYNTKNRYDTSEEWDFLLFGTYAKDEAEAIKNANALISFLHHIIGPIQDHEGWVCTYATSKDSEPIGFAATSMPNTLPGVHFSL